MLEVNQNRMRALMRDFHTLTGIRMVLFDSSMREIMGHPEAPCAFCRAMRKDERFLGRCLACDRAAFRAARASDAPVIYACHAGLTEAVMRVRDAGYVMFGQVIPAETAEAARARLSSACPDAEAVRAVPEKSRAEIEAAATILDALSAYMWSNRLVELSSDDFARMLDEFIDARLTGKLCAQDICRFFGVGRTKLFRMTRERLGHTVAEHILIRRIARARTLLVTTELPVSEVAAGAGFSEYNYFSRVFRDRTGITPRECRRRGG